MAAAHVCCRSVTDRRSCYDHASRANSQAIAVTPCRRATPCWPLRGSQARSRSIHSTLVSQAPGRAVLHCRYGPAERRRWCLPSRDYSMPNKMLIDATHPEETRVVVLRGNRVEEFDFEAASRKQLRGNIYLAKVTRVEPSLQAAFVDYGGNRHGFLAFSEIHPDYYQIPVADRQALIDEEERAARAADAEADSRAGRRAERDRERNASRRRNTIKSEPVETPDGEAEAMAALSEVMAPAANNGEDRHGETASETTCGDTLGGETLGGETFGGETLGEQPEGTPGDASAEATSEPAVGASPEPAETAFVADEPKPNGSGEGAASDSAVS